MPVLKNFVAVDWRAGKDQIYFLFKDTNTYSRFLISENKVLDGYPRNITSDNWHDFHLHAKKLLFGFSTAGVGTTRPFDFDLDILWLFYYEGNVPTFCKYDQDADRVVSIDPVYGSIWHPLLPYFSNIVAGTLNPTALFPRRFDFLLNNGYCLEFDMNKEKVVCEPISERTWPGLAPYKNRIITAVQNDRTILDSHYYIFLTDNEYLRYKLTTHRLLEGPIAVNDGNWPGLLRD